MGIIGDIEHAIGGERSEEWHHGFHHAKEKYEEIITYLMFYALS